MDLQTLKFFCTVASEGSFSKAAEKLHYAQSNLSTKIIQLEHEMDTQLFYRNNHGVTLTEKGEVLLKYADKLINLAQETTIALKDDDSAKGLLKIGSMESTIITYLSQFLSEFNKNNPQTAVQIETGITDIILKQVLEHKLDGGFVCGPIKHDDLITKKVRKEQLALIISKNLNDSDNIKDILKHPIIVFPNGCSYRKNLERIISDNELTVSKIYEFKTLNSIFASVTAGLGVALFPKACIEQYRQHDSLRIIDVPEKYADSSTVFVYRKDHYLSKAMRNFIKSL